MRLRDKVVLVTASTRGIGLACVRACAAEGACVYMAARDMEKARRLAEEIRAAGGRVQCVYSDATHPESITGMVETVAEEQGRLDVLVNNFGISAPGRDLDLARTEPEVFLDTLAVNLRSVFAASRAAARLMAAGQGGSIVNISSVGGVVPDVTQVAYGTSKAAINHLTKQIAVQEARNGIRCNAVLPGITATEAVEKHLTEERRRLFLRQVPLGRMGRPEEVAAAVVYLSSDEAAYVTGQLLAVSGGFGLATPVYGDTVGQAGEKR